MRDYLFLKLLSKQLLSVAHELCLETPFQQLNLRVGVPNHHHRRDRGLRRPHAQAAATQPPLC